MDMEEKVAEAVAPRGAPLARRTLYRVETAALDLVVGVRVGGEVLPAHLLNVSAGGCSVRVQLPLTLRLDGGVTFDVLLPAPSERLVCAGELTGLDVGKGSARMRLRFRAVAPETRRALLSWIGELVTRDMQLRHSGGARALAAVGEAPVYP